MASAVNAGRPALSNDLHLRGGVCINRCCKLTKNRIESTDGVVTIGPDLRSRRPLQMPVDCVNPLMKPVVGRSGAWRRPARVSICRVRLNSLTWSCCADEI